MISPAVVLDHVQKTYGQGAQAHTALQSVSLEVPAGEFLCLLGASGCGKSTLLHLIAGLEPPTSGSVSVPAGGAAMMFQDPALFPWLSVADNIGFPLARKGLGATAQKARVQELLAMVNLDGWGHRQPHELSGGMRQRVALARALAQDARVLLMDEPFAALDAMMRDRLHDEIERVWRETGLTIVFVTHNVREAARLADRVIVLASQPGRIAGEFSVKLPRPRRIDAPEVAQLSRTITDSLRSVLRGNDDAS